MGGGAAARGWPVEVAVTPLQMAMAMAAVANGGQLMRPTLVSGIYDQEGGAAELPGPEVVSTPISPHAAQLLRHVVQLHRGVGVGHVVMLEEHV